MHINKLLLSTPFLNYNHYINSSINIIPINFKLNNNIIPIEIIFFDQNTLISKTNTRFNITSLTHIANVGEIPPLEVVQLLPSNL